MTRGSTSKLLAFAGRPESKRPQHVGMSEESIALVAQERTLNNASHIAAGSHFFGGDLNLIAVAIGIFNRRTKDDSIEPRPQCGAHAHRAGLAS